jgi:hypothetical protein
LGQAAGGKHYLRGWYFAGAPSVLEFVYPKSEAVAIAKGNQATVPPIDPASEGRPVSIKGLSKDDLEVVTLWLLSPTKVGPGDTSGGIQAAKYTKVASVERKPVISRLPQTGSDLPFPRVATRIFPADCGGDARLTSRVPAGRLSVIRTARIEAGFWALGLACAAYLVLCAAQAQVYAYRAANPARATTPAQLPVSGT